MSQEQKAKRKINLPLVAAGAIILLIAVSAVFVTTAEWDFSFGPGDPDPSNPPPFPWEGPREPTSPTYTATVITTPTESFKVSASVRLIGADGTVLKEQKLFAVWEIGEHKVEYVEIPFHIELLSRTTVTEGTTVSVTVPEQEVEIYVYIRIKHDDLAASLVASKVLEAAESALNGESATPILFGYEPLSADEILITYSASKRVIGSWGGKFYFVPDSLFSEFYDAMGDAAFGTYEISVSMKVMIPSASIYTASSWVTFTLEARPYPDSTETPGGPSIPEPPEPKPPILPISVVWRP